MTLGEMLHASAVKNPDKPALVCGERIVSYHKLNETTDALASWLLTQGLKSGDRVAIHWSNSVETVSLYFACFKSGLIAVPVNNCLKAREIAYVLEHSKAKLCFSQPELAPLSEEVRGECSHLLAIHTAAFGGMLARRSASTSDGGSGRGGTLYLRDKGAPQGCNAHACFAHRRDGIDGITRL